MSNAIIPANLQIPAHLAARLQQPSSLAASLAAGLGTGISVPRISIKGARFRIVEGKTETVLDEIKLKTVIVGANPAVTKTFYGKAWDPNDEATGPDCYSNDGKVPAADAEKPQSDGCALCPHNQWGSKISPNGQKIKACADQKKLAVVAGDDPDGPVYLLQVTPAALKELNQYQRELSLRGIPPEVVFTTLSFDTDASFPKLKFSFGGFLDSQTQAVVDGLFGTDKVRDVTGETTEVVATPAPVAAPKPQSVRVVETKPEPEVVEAVVEEVVEEAPAPKRGFGAKAAPAAPVAAPKPVAKAKPAPVTVVDETSGGSLADEIAALVNGLNTDDE
jgi:hypothetical protein